MSIFLLYSSLALLVFRVMVGVVLLAHGIPKLRDWKGTTAWFQSVGFRPGWLWGTVAAIMESFGALLLMVGVLVRPLAALFMVQFLVIIIWKIARKTSFTGPNGWEIDWLMLAAMAVLLTAGATVL